MKAPVSAIEMVDMLWATGRVPSLGTTTGLVVFDNASWFASADAGVAAAPFEPQLDPRSAPARWESEDDCFVVLSSVDEPEITRAEVVKRIASERAWFEEMRQNLRAKYGSVYVAVFGRRVVDSDTFLPDLLSRFFCRFGDVPAYFGYTGAEPPAVVLGG